MTSQIETIEHDGVRYAIIMSSARHESGVRFYTPDDASLQVGAFALATGHEIEPHLHKPCERILQFTAEVLVIQSGRLQVDFYDARQTYLRSHILSGGDVIVLLEGGHGFKVLEDLRMLEVKQGPYAGMNDKIRFQRPEQTGQSAPDRTSR